jgi:hypothetical protein
MILVWDNARSFQRHVEAMRIFRRSHAMRPLEHLFFRDMPSPYDIDLDRGGKLIKSLTDSRGRAIIVPIWKISAPPGSQN